MPGIPGEDCRKMSETCIRCGRPLKPLDCGATKKFINRGATEFLCLHCLAAELKVTEERLLEKIEFFKKQGCTLF